MRGVGAGGTRPNVGAGGTRPNVGAGAGGTKPSLAAGERPSAGQLNNFLDMPRASTGAGGIGGGSSGRWNRRRQRGGRFSGTRRRRSGSTSGRAGSGRSPRVALQAAAYPCWLQAAAYPALARASEGPELAHRESGFRASGCRVSVGRASEIQGWDGQEPVWAPGVEILPTTGRAGLKTANSGRAIATSAATKCAIRSAKTILGSTFGATIPIGRRWRINRPYRWAAWAAIGGWCGYGATASSYSYGENIYYEEDQVYYGDQPVATAEQYTDQAAAIAAGGQNVDPAKSDWLPLGVFALTQDGAATGPDPSMFLQLAINKRGSSPAHSPDTATGDVQTSKERPTKKPTRRLVPDRQAIADRRNGTRESHARHRPRADPFCRRPNATMAAGASRRAQIKTRPIAVFRFAKEQHALSRSERRQWAVRQVAGLWPFGPLPKVPQPSGWPPNSALRAASSA